MLCRALWNFIESYFSDPFFDRATAARPLLLKASFNQPHYPYHTDQSKFEYYLNRVEPYLDQELFLTIPFYPSGKSDRAWM